MRVFRSVHLLTGKGHLTGMYRICSRNVKTTCMQGSFGDIQISIIDYFEYLPVGPRESVWTLSVTAVGRTRIAPGAPYPPPRHPEDHSFTWERGRILSAFQIVAISEGTGLLELKSQSWKLSTGCVFVLAPGTWHRYRPDLETGWTEEWIELRGTTLQVWLAAGILDIAPINMRTVNPFWKWFEELHALCVSHPQGYRAIAAGIGMTLLASVIAESEGTSRTSELTTTLRAARKLLMEGQGVDAIARSLGISYPTFFRQFKKATGLSPKEYAREVRLARAEELLSGSSLSVKEIASRLGYFSASHFSLEFRKGRGVSPAAWPGRI